MANEYKKLLSIGKPIKYNALWNVKEYSYLNAVKSNISPIIPYSEVNKCIDSKGRSLILIGLGDIGNIVLFDMIERIGNGVVIEYPESIEHILEKHELLRVVKDCTKYDFKKIKAIDLIKLMELINNNELRV